MDKHKNAFAIITLLAITAVTSPVSAQDDLRILRRGIAGDPESLDPHRLLSAFESTIMTDMFIALATTAPDDSPIPGSAESWIVSDDGLTYTFNMRDGLLWSDGTPLDAYDYLYSFRRQLDPATASRTAEYFRPIVNAKAVLPIPGLEASTIISDLCQPPVKLSKSVNPEGTPLTPPSCDLALSILSIAFLTTELIVS